MCGGNQSVPVSPVEWIRVPSVDLLDPVPERGLLDDILLVLRIVFERWVARVGVTEQHRIEPVGIVGVRLDDFLVTCLAPTQGAVPHVHGHRDEFAAVAGDEYPWSDPHRVAFDGPHSIPVGVQVVSRRMFIAAVAKAVCHDAPVGHLAPEFGLGLHKLPDVVGHLLLVSLDQLVELFKLISVHLIISK